MSALCFSFLMIGCAAQYKELCYLDVDGYYQNCDSSISNYGSDTGSSSISYGSQQYAVTEQDPNIEGQHFKLLDEYAEQLAADLASGVHGPVRAGIAVASFVYLDSELKTTSVLGNQFSESLIHELQRYNLPMVDTKVSRRLKVTNSGDFIFSRASHELTRKQNYGYVLSGTMLKEARGILIQSRIINIRNKQVLTTATKFIPNLVAGSL